jgi:CRISPR-associated protein (TIGR03984 family)
LAHCDDGVVWGRLSDASWKFAPERFREFTPVLSSQNLQQLRVFGAQSETLIWRTDDGFRGRVLSDSSQSVEDWGKPLDEEWVLLGDRVKVQTADGFTAVEDATGSRQVVPVECFEKDFIVGKKVGISPLRLRVRHYFEQDERSGSVRIAATRLVELYKGAANV